MHMKGRSTWGAVSYTLLGHHLHEALHIRADLHHATRTGDIYPTPTDFAVSMVVLISVKECALPFFSLLISVKECALPFFLTTMCNENASRTSQNYKMCSALSVSAL
ncbi:unnamed protein product [Ixodes pacificus]